MGILGKYDNYSPEGKELFDEIVKTLKLDKITAWMSKQLNKYRIFKILDN
jgi:hypothetical protein